MADEYHVPEIFVLQDVDDVGHVGLETDFGASKVASLAESGERGSGDEVLGGSRGVPSLAQERHDLLPEPGSVPCRVNEDERLRSHRLRLEAHRCRETGRISGGPEHVPTRRLQMRGHGRDNAATAALLS